MKTLLLVLTLGLASLAHAEVWLTDYDKALAQAKIQKRPVLVDFTGSDWCIWCMKLHSEVFSQPVFESWAQKKVVLLKLDFPRRTPQSDAVKKANAALAEKYHIEGFPTILILDENGNEKARTGYRRGGPEAYVKQLETLLK